MIAQPVIHPVLIALLGGALLLVAGRALLRSGGAARALWAGRIVLVLACVAMLLRPGVPGVPARIAATDLDVLLVVDTTASIAAEDWAGGRPRLEGVRADVDALIEAYPGARFGLVAFDADAQVRMPFSHDTTALGSAMAVLGTEVTAYSRGSSIGVAHQRVLETLRSAAETTTGRSRMVFYFGDGEQTAARPPESFAEAAPYVDGGLVLGYGTASGGPMRENRGVPDAEPGRYIQHGGAPALSVIDEDALRKVAADLGVEYRHRDATSAPAFPTMPTTTLDHSAAATARIVGDLTWVPAIVVFVVLAIELMRATMRVVQLRALVVRGGGRDPDADDSRTPAAGVRT